MSYGYGGGVGTGYGPYSGSFGGRPQGPIYHQNYGGGYGGYGGDSFSGRETNWCPSGEGYPAYCPQGGDDYSYTHCCTPFFIGSYEPTCCYFAISMWNILAIIVGIILLLALLFVVFRYCWPSLYPNRRRRNPSVAVHQQTRYPQQQRLPEPAVVYYEKEPFRHY